jgi:RNA recognition motif-containing protein
MAAFLIAGSITASPPASFRLSEGASIMEVKLYVGNLPYNTTEEDLRSMFSQAGKVESVSLIKDWDTGRSKGFAFVAMGTQVDAENAIKMFDSYELEGRQLKVNIARPREERGGGGYGDRRGGGGGYGGGQRGGGGSRDRNRRGGGGGTRRY